MSRLTQPSPSTFALLPLLLIMGFASGCSEHNSGTAAVPLDTARVSSRGWTLAWNDEFNGPNGGAPDSTKWTLETGGSGWGNDELEYYTSRQVNAHQQDGNLVIAAVKEHYVGPDGVAR